MLSVVWNKLWTYLYLFLFRPILKCVLHLVTGECEVQRIAYGYEKGSNRTKKLEESLCLSRNSYLRQLIASENIETNVDEVLVKVLSIKNIKREKDPLFFGIFKISLLQITGYNDLLTEVDAKRKTVFSSDNSEHEANLMKLWTSLKPEVPLKSRISDQWVDIGFQGDNPLTDFRGMGILGLDQLVFFANSYPAQAKSLLSRSQHPTKGYFFAIVGINITSLLYHILKSGALKTHFYNVVARKPSMRDLHEVYCYLFYEFDSFWFKENPKDIMQFERIRNKFKTEIEELLQEPSTTLQTPFQKARAS